MMQFDRISLGRQAKELGFVRDTLALKGGTAINRVNVNIFLYNSSHCATTSISVKRFANSRRFLTVKSMVEA